MLQKANTHKYEYRGSVLIHEQIQQEMPEKKIEAQIFKEWFAVNFFQYFT